MCKNERCTNSFKNKKEFCCVCEHFLVIDRVEMEICHECGSYYGELLDSDERGSVKVVDKCDKCTKKEEKV